MKNVGVVSRVATYVCVHDACVRVYMYVCASMVYMYVCVLVCMCVHAMEPLIKDPPRREQPL